ncbi:MAG: lactate utilization protein, partial [Clostridia bacterium]|nr:lactate utilization protein [Clostridia bacterium]
MNTIDTIKNNFVRRGFHFDYFEDCFDAISFVLSLIPEGSSIGFGGSVSVTESGLLDAMLKKNYDLIHRAIRTDIPYDEIYARMYACDWYVSSANAITETGEVINIDGRGNRVSAILDGPKKVVIFCGTNKIVKDIAEGINRT